MSRGTVLRAPRAAVFAAVAAMLAAFGHTLSTNAAISVPVFAQAWCALFAAAYALAGRERGPAGIAAFTLGAQIALHAWFGATQVTQASPRCAAVVDLHSGLSVPAVCSAHLMPVWAANTVAVGVYALAVVLCAWWLHRAEAAAFAIGRAVAVGVHVLLSAVALLVGFAPLAQTPLPRRRGPAPQRHRPLSADACLPVVRRGPPMVHAV